MTEQIEECPRCGAAVIQKRTPPSRGRRPGQRVLRVDQAGVLVWACTRCSWRQPVAAT